MWVCRTFEEHLIRQVQAHFLAFEQFNEEFVNMNYLVPFVGKEFVCSCVFS
jgi:hypothetical protein